MELQLHGSTKDGVIVRAGNLNLANFNIVDILKEKLQYNNIFLRNDAKSAALCEKEYGSLKTFEDSVFICLGTGIGGAVFKNRKVFKSKKT